MLRPLASFTRVTDRVPTFHTLSDIADTTRPSGVTDHTDGVWPTSEQMGKRRPSVRHTSVSPVTHSRRSDSCGRWSDLASGARLNCESRMMGTFSSFARPLIDREIEANSNVRFSKRPRPVINWT